MLAGELPFLANKTVNLLRLNKRNKINFSCPWISKQAQDFIKALKTHIRGGNPVMRLTVSEALKNPWLRKLSSTVLTSFKERQKYSESSYGSCNVMIKTIQSEYSTSNANDSLELNLIQDCDEKGKINTPLPSKELHQFLASMKQSERKRSFIEYKRSGKDTLPEFNSRNIDKHESCNSFLLTFNEVLLKP
jgi:hypothetical protein